MDDIYTTREGDHWDAIAKRVYGNELRADFLMKANPEHLDIFQFGYGVELRTPELPVALSGSAPPWRN